MEKLLDHSAEMGLILGLFFPEMLISELQFPMGKLYLICSIDFQGRMRL